MRRLPQTLTAAILGVSFLCGDFADAATCFTLQAELTHLQSRGVGGSGDRARYERAWREQSNVIARAEAQARDAGCFGSGSVFQRDSSGATCNNLIAKLRDMQVNLDRLDRLRMSAGTDNAERIRLVQGMLADQACGGSGDQWGNEVNNDWSQGLSRIYSGYGTYRTVCVRTCDGYYFPISYSATTDQLPADAHTCSAMCPGADARLYYYPNPGGTPEEMISLDGGSYADLPTAFLYRSSVQPACKCGSLGASSSITAALEGTSGIEVTARLPRARPAPGDDPETLANRAGNFVPGTASGGATASGDTFVTEGGRTIRVVGPTFGASAEQEGALLNPIPEEPEGEVR